MQEAVLFDDGKGQLAPLTDLRASFEVRTGALTTFERLVACFDLDVRGLVVPDAIRDLVAVRHTVPINAPPDAQGDVLMLNGRCVLPFERIDLIRTGEVLVDQETGDLIAALAKPADCVRLVRGDLSGYEQTLGPDIAMLERPWHVRSFRDIAIDADLAMLTERAGWESPPDGTIIVGDRFPLIDRNATVHPSATFDCDSGLVIVDRDATIRPGAVLIGPCYVGPGATVLDRAIIRPNTVVGPVCKVAGEVGGTIFQGYANKAHDGYLGDSWVGTWVNLGAGTTNSNLLNTYGNVKAQATPDGEREDSGEQFLGCVLGDHVKTAICTRIMTGAVAHTGAMFAASSPMSGCVRPFAWVTDAGEQTYDGEKFVEVARSVMHRRGVNASDAYVRRLHELHEAAAR